MQDPYLMRNPMYLRELERHASRTRFQNQQKARGNAFNFQLRAMAALLVVAVVLVLDPLGV